MEKSRGPGADHPDGLDLEGATVFMRKVLELVIGLPNEFYVMEGAAGDAVARPKTTMVAPFVHTIHPNALFISVL